MRDRRGLEHRRQAADHEHARGDHRRGVDQRARPGSGPPSRRAARCGGRAAPTCPSRRRTAAGRAGSSCRRACRGSRSSSPPCPARRRGSSGSRRCRTPGRCRRCRAMKPKSPTRLTTNALIAAALAEGFVIPEADQQIGGEADAFPAEEHLDEVVGGHQHQHREGEQRQIGEEARLVRVLLHIAPAVEVDERRDASSPPPASPRSACRRAAPSRRRASPDWIQVQHRVDRSASPCPSRKPRKIGQLSAQPMNSAPVVSDLGGDVADHAVAEPGDDRREQRQEDDRLDHGCISPSSG